MDGMLKRLWRKRILRGVLLLLLSGGLVGTGVLVLWVATWKLPDLSAFNERKVAESTKIYDRTGEVLLYDLHGGAKRTVVSWSDISLNIKNATVAIEDNEFFSHHGVRPKAVLRAVLSNLLKGDLLGGQGGSTITQQVVKNSLLTSKKKLSRKLKEWVLAIKLEQTMNKEEILALYLNEVPYGGQVYGIEEASRTFLGKSARELSIAESAYLSALPNAPTYYSPYGNHRDALENRKNLVLAQMLENNFITPEEYEQAKKETVTFKPHSDTGILAPHFTIFIQQYLEEKYGRAMLEEQGLTVVTTLDYELQKIAEDIVKKYALANKEKFDAENAAILALDPKTGQILVMVGSRDYFDKDIQGNFNATIAFRQPGSAFKPFVYAQALREGYTPETVVFDLPTEFSTECNPDGTPLITGNEDKCYRPVNYDGKYHGPISFRDALAQSVNIPAVKVLYLAGLPDSLRLAKEMGIGTLADPGRYGLTLVLGGGEVKLLDLTSAYGVFAAEGVRREPAGILRIEKKDGTILEENINREESVLEENVALQITDMLSDNKARAPAFGATSPLYFPNRDVAAKTGTTNDYRDAWIIGYTPNISVGAWAGNNDNRPMQKKVAAYIVAPMWNEFMKEALKRLPSESFRKPEEVDTSLFPPILRGVWQGNKTYFVDKLSGKLATEFTPPSLKEERAVQSVHSILYWIDKNNPKVTRVSAPESDMQFPRWEYAVRKWATENGYADQSETVMPSQFDDLHSPSLSPKVSLLNPAQGEVLTKESQLSIKTVAVGSFPVSKVHFFVNNFFAGSDEKSPFEIKISLSEIPELAEVNEVKVVAYDILGNKGEATTNFTVTE